jgi:hypothetical protein
MAEKNLAVCFLNKPASKLPQHKTFTMNDIGVGGRRGIRRLKLKKWDSVSFEVSKYRELCYSVFALITSVVLCGPSGAVLDLRLPPAVFSVSFTRNLNQGWQSKPPVRLYVCARTATASASKKAILNVECF